MDQVAVGALVVPLRMSTLTSDGNSRNAQYWGDRVFWCVSYDVDYAEFFNNTRKHRF